MSGVFGYVTDRSTPVSAVTNAMATGLRHRSYQTATVTIPHPQVGIGRITIGIFNRESQPVGRSGQHVQLWMCGELYHQDDLRNDLIRQGWLSSNATDADLALACYCQDGIAGLQTLKGAFLIAIWDDAQQRLVLVNDRYGLYPHFYAQTTNGFAFAPEIKALLAVPELPRNLDMTAIAEYVRFQQLLGDRTWLEEVRLLPPGSILIYQLHEQTLSLQQYWGWDAIGDLPSIGFDEAVEESSRLFQRAIDAMTGPPYRTGVYLSGGMDSRTIVGFIDEAVPVTTLSYGDGRSRDVFLAAEIARRAGSDHHWFPFTSGRWVRDYAEVHLRLTEGRHSWVHSHGMSTLDEARQLVDVNLIGWDGGTVLGGHLAGYAKDRYYRSAPTEPDFIQRMFEGFCHEFTWPGLTEAETANVLVSPDLKTRAYDSFRTVTTASGYYPSDYCADYVYIGQHVLKSTINMVVFTRSAIEVRCPFFDYDLIDFLYALPGKVRRTPAFYRAVLNGRSPELTLVPAEEDYLLPTTNRLRYHPHAFMQRGKGRINRWLPGLFPGRPWLYADYESYLRTDLREWAAGYLFDERARNRGLFRPAAVAALWEQHLSGAELWTIGKIAPLIEIERVIRLLFDEDEPNTAQTIVTASGEVASHTRG